MRRDWRELVVGLMHVDNVDSVVDGGVVMLEMRRDERTMVKMYLNDFLCFVGLLAQFLN